MRNSSGRNVFNGGVCPEEIPGVAGYGASADGQIADLRNGRILAQRPAANGALQVHIGKSTRMVHDLVARAFHGHPLCRGFRVRHANGDPTDNRLENLVWAGRPQIKNRPMLPRRLDTEYLEVRLERESMAVLMQSRPHNAGPPRHNGRP